jgi:hypothetical protein
MASFTDKIQTFNPYVSQLPVEAMVQVGMQKQAQYDAGVQKIQGYIDNIAGMDVANDADKAYLQSKLNDLGGKLKTVAAGDFSNQQLINSVGGMATSIVKDQNVQNAVSSTQWYRKQLAEMEKAVTEGKSSIENVEDFNKQASAWLSSGKAGQVFRGRYSPYVDVKKKILTDVIGKINPNVREEDIPWEMNADGTVNTGKIAAVMTRVSGEAVTAQQLQNAINASLTPADLNQLAISGRYQFRNATPEQLSAVATKRFEDSDRDIDNMIAKLEGHATASKSDTVEYNKTLDAIQQLKDRKVTLSDQLAKEVKWITENPEEAKAELYKNGFVNSFAEAFSWEKKKKTILDNPYQDYKFKLADQRLKEQKFALDKAEFSWKKQMDVANLDIEKQKLDLNLKKFYGESGGLETYLGESTLVKDPVIAIQQDRDTYRSNYNDFIKEFAKKNNISLSQAQDKLTAYQNGDKNAINVQSRGKADIAIDNLLQSDRLNILLKKAEEEASNDPKVIASREAYNKAVSKLPGATIRTNGREYKFTSKEVSDFVSKFKRVAATTSAEDVRFKGGQMDVIDPTKLTDNEKVMYNIVQNAGKNPDAARTLNAVFARHKPLVEGYERDKKLYTDALKTNLLEKTGKYIPKLEAIMVSDKDGAQSRDNLETLANLALSTYTGVAGSQPGGAAELSTEQAAAAKEWLTGKDKGSIFYSKLSQGDKKFLVMQKGGQEIVVPLTPQMVGQLPKSKTEMSVGEEDIREVQQHFGGNTNPSNDPRKAYFQPRAFSSVNKIAVTADLQKDETSALNFLNLNLKLPSGWKNLQLDDVPLDVPTAQTQISKFTDNDVLNIYLRSDQVPQAWKDEIIRTYQRK